MPASLIAALLILFVSIGLWLGVFGIFQPIKQVVLDISGAAQKGLSKPLRWGKDVWRSYIALQGVKAENESLKQEIAQLQQKITSYNEALIANARYKKLLDIKRESKTPVVTATVIGNDLAPWVWSLTIDKGLNDGIGPEMAVMSGAGVIGQIIEASDHFSKVLLLADRNSAVAALDQRSRIPGILKGNGDGMCRLAYVGKEDDVGVGDEIITSGTDQIFPKGLLLGKVTAVEKMSSSDIFQIITVKPSVELKQVEEVIVQIKGEPLVEGLH
ncbi:MAG: rod shape-determining protein MreC [Dissulfurimicrobium sp.]|uniref:rod shape-determining protein MreC n=1 Tax=Dissulfurimicrobium sp. TaxID=2022436 RepID=UPI00404BA12D